MNTKDPIAEALDIEPIESQSDFYPVDYDGDIVAGDLVIQNGEEQIDIDYGYARSNLYDLIQKGTSAIDGILAVARESHHPRAFEVAATLIKNMGDVNDKLLNLHKTKKELDKITVSKSEEEDQPSINVEKAIFVGSTTDLLRKIKSEI